jgi:hypothetical protein
MLVIQTGNQVKINSSANLMVIKTKAITPLPNLKNNFPHLANLKVTTDTGRFNRFKIL